MEGPMRNYGDKVDIDPQAVRKLFDDRFDPQAPLLSVMLSKDKVKLEARDEREKAQIVPQLQLDPAMSRVLDVGCGYGRWFEALRGRVARYEGCDFSEPYIRLAKATYSGHPEAEFRVLSATDIGPNTLQFPPYTLFISCALYQYLNDSQIEESLRRAVPLMAAASQIYIRCSVSVMDGRLTLKDFPSAEMGTDYHAIYRTTAEYEGVFARVLYPAGYVLQSSRLLLDEATGARSETNQRYWLMERNGL